MMCPSAFLSLAATAVNPVRAPFGCGVLGGGDTSSQSKRNFPPIHRDSISISSGNSHFPQAQVRINLGWKEPGPDLGGGTKPKLGEGRLIVPEEKI